MGRDPKVPAPITAHARVQILTSEVCSAEDAPGMLLLHVQCGRAVVRCAQIELICWVFEWATGHTIVQGTAHD